MLVATQVANVLFWYESCFIIRLDTVLHEIFATSYFREFRDLKKNSQNLSDVKNKCHEHNMTRKLSDALGRNQERISLVY